MLRGALVQLGCKSPTEDDEEEEAILDFFVISIWIQIYLSIFVISINLCYSYLDVFVPLSMEEGKSLCLHQSSVRF